MTSQFGKKLFRLFLLFSLLPALLLAVVGYFVAVETSSFSPAQTTADLKALTDYYNTLLFQRLDDCLSESFPPDTASLSELPDFLFLSSPEGTTILRQRFPLSEAVRQSIAAAAQKRRQGFVELERMTYQYTARKLAADSLLIGGIRHDSRYASLLESLEKEYLSGTWTKELRASYVLFVFVVFIVLAAVTASLAYFFSARLSRSLSRPLLELSEASRAIAEGDFKQQVPLSGSGEIRSLIASFNSMAAQLERMTNRLAQSERVAAWRQVARRFAHELKNPLQPILISLFRLEQMLKETPVDYERVTEALHAVSQEITHLRELADRFSQLAKLPPPKFVTLNLNEMLTSLTQLYREQLSQYDFSLQLPSEQIYLDADETYFREALHNLLQNAMEASEKKGKIILTLSRTPQTIEITVRDFGVGMSEEELAAARMPYVTTKEKGNGIGLAVVEKTVTEMGGQLIITSQKNHGTTVTLSFPIKETPDGAAKDSHR